MSSIDTAALLGWLKPRLPSIEGPLTLRRFAGGQSNPTYALEHAAGRYVLRMKPAGPLLPSAHQIEREYRVLHALELTPVPVPRTVILCQDRSVIGTPFYVMQYLDGRVFTDPALPNVPPADRRELYESAFTTLAALHAVDFHTAGLSDFGRAQGYLARQVARWTKQYRASQTGVIPSMDALIEWLPANIPASEEAALAHGDYRLGNILFAPTEPRPIGVLDWELSTIGDPLLDVAYAVLMHAMPLDVLRGMGGSTALAQVDGIPSADALVAVYCAAARRPLPGGMHFYLALAYFRSAGIMQGIAHRIALGNASGGPEAAARAAATPHLARLGWEMACAGQA